MALLWYKYLPVNGTIVLNRAPREGREALWRLFRDLRRPTDPKLALNPKFQVTVVRPLEVDEDWWMDMDQGTPLPEKYEVGPKVQTLDPQPLNPWNLESLTPCTLPQVEPSVEGSMIATEEGGESTALEVEAAELKRFKGKGVSRITIKVCNILFTVPC